MDEGAFRILRALGDGSAAPAATLTRRAGESSSVLKALRNAHPEWFVESDDGISASQKGLAALAREWSERARGEAVSSTDTLIDELRELASARKPPKRELDQVYATWETVVARARLLVAAGEVQRGLCFLGDDDLTSLAVQLFESPRRVTVVDIDADVLKLIGMVAASREWPVRTVLHDLREPLEKSLQGRQGCVFCDPPYAIEGFTLFMGRAVEALRPDGRLYVCFGSSRRAPERGLQKQKMLAEAGWLVEAVWEDFNVYDGAESIGARSSLWRLRKNPATKSLASEIAGERLYTSRAP